MNNIEDNRRGICTGFMLHKEACETCKEGKEKHYCGEILYKMLVKFYKEYEERYE